jgi:hypothetical protein
LQSRFCKRHLGTSDRASLSAMRVTSEIHRLNSIAGFMTGDSDLWVTGRFERLHLINLLSIQVRLSNLEEEVNGHVLYEQHLIGHEPHPKPTRTSEEIFADLQITIKAYGKLSALLNLSYIDHLCRRCNVIFSKVETERSSCSPYYKSSQGRRTPVCRLLQETWYSK